MKECTRCEGNGHVDTGLNFESSFNSKICPACDGTGIVDDTEKIKKVRANNNEPKLYYYTGEGMDMS